MAQDDVFGFGVHFADQQLGTVDDTRGWRLWGYEGTGRSPVTPLSGSSGGCAYWPGQ
ncbi:hypothetical protein ACYSUO_39620 [Streptomyces sp. UC4497]